MKDLGAIGGIVAAAVAGATLAALLTEGGWVLFGPVILALAVVVSLACCSRR